MKADRLIVPLAAAGLVISLNIILGPITGSVFAAIAGLIVYRHERAAAKRVEAEQRQAVREAAWRAGDRRWSR
jgi:hypothetical protein